MVDLRERFEAADQIAAPDLWDLVREKAATPTDARSPKLRLVGDAGDAGDRRRADVRKVLTIAAAFLIVALAFGWVLRSIWAGETVPGGQPTPSAFEGVHGWIVVGGQRLVATDPASPSRSEVVSGAGGDPLAWSNDGNALLVHRFENGKNELFVFTSDGRQIRITTDGLSGSFTPDGAEVVYGGSDLSVDAVSSMGGEPRTIVSADPDTGVGYGFPVLSPDGSTIAYAATSKTGDQGIAVMNADGSRPRVIADLSKIESSLGRRPEPCACVRPVVRDIYVMAWSPDGSEIVFGEADQGGIADAVLIVGTDGSGLHEISPPGPGRWWSAAWSPDGKRVALATNTRIIEMNPDGTSAMDLGIDPGEGFVAWNPGT